MKIRRAFADELEMWVRLMRTQEAREGGPLTVEEQRKCGYTPPGFKSSQPKAAR